MLGAHPAIQASTHLFDRGGHTADGRELRAVGTRTLACLILHEQARTRGVLQPASQVTCCVDHVQCKVQAMTPK